MAEIRRGHCSPPQAPLHPHPGFYPFRMARLLLPRRSPVDPPHLCLTVQHKWAKLHQITWPPCRQASGRDNS
eukprot:369521-Pelagomonas_calceolata.AAC.2